MAGQTQIIDILRRFQSVFLSLVQYRRWLLYDMSLDHEVIRVVYTGRITLVLSTRQVGEIQLLTGWQNGSHWVILKVCIYPNVPRWEITPLSKERYFQGPLGMYDIQYVLQTMHDEVTSCGISDYGNEKKEIYR